MMDAKAGMECLGLMACKPYTFFHFYQQPETMWR